MIIDSYLLFTGTSNGASGGITSTSTTDAPTAGTQTASNIIDIGIGSSTNPGIPSLANGAGARDLGIGDKPVLQLNVVVAVAFVGGTSLQITLSGAPDNGSGAAGSYTTMYTSAAVALADLDVGAQISNVDVPRVIPGQTSLPRFLRLQFISSGTFSGGTVCGAIVLDKIAQVQGTDSKLSGYPAGINIAN
jgi:hypothetical protein